MILFSIYYMKKDASFFINLIELLSNFIEFRGILFICYCVFYISNIVVSIWIFINTLFINSPPILQGGFLTFFLHCFKQY